jgi:hypothetical protein
VTDKKREITHEIREMTRLQLKAAGIDFELTGDIDEKEVMMDFDVLCRLIWEIQDYHQRIHNIRSYLEAQFPAVRLADMLDNECADHVKRWPTSPEMREMAKEKFQASAGNAIGELLGKIFEARGASKPEEPDKLN